MVSLQRRQLLIAGAASPALVPLAGWSFERPERMVVSGRVLGRDGNPFAGVGFAVGENTVTTDADGRFVVVTDTHRARNFMSGAQRDSDGTWRTTLGVVLT